jgi:cell division protein FtsI/penicillin-binding protein 2
MEPGNIEIGTEEESFAKSAAGFGPGKISPLSAAYMMSIIARGGDRVGLSLIDHFVSPQGQILPALPSSGDTGRVLRASTASYLTRMLEVTIREGTCANAFRDPNGDHYLGNIRVAGKTGTLFRAHPKRLYSWFAGFAPANKPQIAIAVMLANNTSWWRKANEVGRDVLRAYFSRKGAHVEHPFALRSKPGR